MTTEILEYLNDINNKMNEVKEQIAWLKRMKVIAQEGFEGALVVSLYAVKAPRGRTEDFCDTMIAEYEKQLDKLEIEFAGL